jgi:predicted RecB family nuclease
VRRYHDSLLYSASDLVTFLGCRHATFLDRRQLDAPVPLGDADPYLALLQQKGIEHERAYLERLRDEGREIVEIAGDGSLEDRVARTRAAMAAGVEVIYQGALRRGSWHGYADFLIRVPGESRLGPYCYEPVDTKLAHTEKPKHVLQLCVYAELLGVEQGARPVHLHIVLGVGPPITLLLADFHYYFALAQQRFEAFIDELPAASVGAPCNHCGLCRWQAQCESEWQAADHLSLVAGIARGQIAKLHAAGVYTMAALAAMTGAAKIPKLQTDTLLRLGTQARLQHAKRSDGRNRTELLPPMPGRGFYRLPPPDPGDLFFDMEGDPLVPGGLEYLFGFVHVERDVQAARDVQPDPGVQCFTAFWGHDRAREKQAFEDAVDFITARLAAYPDAHVYHYAAYEETALKRLAMVHGTRETAIDNWLRQGRLIDLYRVVREAIRVSEPSYSIKNLEVFYMPARTGEVKDAGSSVVVYERWRQLGDDGLLQEIADYNEVDCISTLKLRDWLLTLRSPDIPWYEGMDEAGEPEREADRKAGEQRMANTIERLLQGPAMERPFRELVGQLLEFHRREAKPQWWALFQRRDMTEEQLIDDAECIGGLRRDFSIAPFKDKRSMVYTFSFPPQDCKIRVGGKPLRAGTLETAGEIVALDEESNRLQLKVGPKTAPLEDALSLIPEPPLADKVLREAIYRYAETIIAQSDRYAAVSSVLQAQLPRIRGHVPGEPLLAPDEDAVRVAVDIISRLDHSHLLIQGPPGAGKTYVSAAAIVDLLSHGRRVGIASNSHKAINNLLDEIERQAMRSGVVFRGVKKCSTDDHRCAGTMIENVFDNAEVGPQYDLVAGTAWLFARPEFDQTLDHLFIDEAGQVSLGNLVAMGLCARNVVLVGDQMQLAQPIQGAHPGQSGRSALEFLLGDHATVPPERGIFLGVTRRMHPDVCEFISAAMYEGRLHSEPSTEVQRLNLGAGADAALKASGISFVSVSHQDCRQKSEEESERIEAMFNSLLLQRWTDSDGLARPMGVADILVVSPYNMQVNLLKSKLPAGARVGTVDRFQGQEAPVVIISMTTSSAEDMPRNMEFLYSRNRLNVAVSRARSLAVIVASPLLLEAPCTGVEQLRLVNTMCFAEAYAGA